jgi:nucleoside-diphosphate-sugar epimerase
MPVLVTGATGFVGRSVVRELRSRTHVVRALARSDAAEQTVRELRAQPVRGSLADLDVLRREALGADAVVHCAFDYNPSADGVALERAALETLLDALPAGRTFIYTSGVWVYGSRGDASVDEKAPLAPIPIVAWRPAHEELVLAHDGRLRAAVIRPGIVYGDGGGIPGQFMEAARAGMLRIIGDGANRWPTVRHDALGELYGLIVDRLDAHGIFNAVRGASVPYGEVVNACARAAGIEAPVESITLEAARGMLGPFADALVLDQTIDATKAERELGWEPHRPTLLEELAASVVV